MQPSHTPNCGTSNYQYMPLDLSDKAVIDLVLLISTVSDLHLWEQTSVEDWWSANDYLRWGICWCVFVWFPNRSSDHENAYENLAADGTEDRVTAMWLILDQSCPLLGHVLQQSVSLALWWVWKDKDTCGYKHRHTHMDIDMHVLISTHSQSLAHSHTHMYNFIQIGISHTTGQLCYATVAHTLTHTETYQTESWKYNQGINKGLHNSISIVGSVTVTMYPLTIVISDYLVTFEWLCIANPWNIKFNFFLIITTDSNLSSYHYLQ